MEEQKRYRNSFIFLTLVATAGILLGLYLYEYTDYFAELKINADVIGTGFDIKAMILMFFDEIKLPALCFIMGFTLFSAYISTAILAYKGFLTGFSVLYLGLYYSNGAIDKPRFVLSALALILILLIYIITAAKALAFAGSLRYAAPDIISLLKRKNTVKYLITFLILSAFLLMALTLKYLIPIIKI